MKAAVFEFSITILMVAFFVGIGFDLGRRSGAKETVDLDEPRDPAVVVWSLKNGN